jgi:DNA-binding LacI/PurR family transcriptional regulator
VGVIAMEAADFAPASILLGFERAARDHGYLTITSRLPSLDRHAVTAAIDELKRHRVEGIALHTGLRQVPPAVTQFSAHHPDGRGGGSPPRPRCGPPRWTSSPVPSGRPACRSSSVIARSRTSPAPQDSMLARQRLDAWHSVLTAAGIAASTPLSKATGAHDPGYELGRGSPPTRTVTAIFANDAMAIGLARAPRRRTTRTRRRRQPRRLR